MKKVVFTMFFCFVVVSATMTFAETIPQQQPVGTELLERQVKVFASQARQQRVLLREQGKLIQEQKNLADKQTAERALAMREQEKLAAAQETERTVAMREQKELAATQAQAAAKLKAIIMTAAGVILLCAVILIMVIIIFRRRQWVVAASTATNGGQTRKGVLIDPTSEELKKIAADTGAREIRFDLPLKSEDLIFECIAIMSGDGLKVRFLKDPDQNWIGWDKRRHYADNHLNFANKKAK